ncbi:MAG: hypothetical protein KDB23_32980, partial [Planctomycetales bacterium]|nr:hypothetical protein [Planctomycetales bacterium]
VPGPDSSSPHVITEVDGRIYFGTTNHITSKTELWQTDGSGAGTTHVFAWPFTDGIRTVLEANGKAYVQLAKSFQQLWTTDGIPANTVPVSEDQLKLAPIVELDGYVFFIDSRGVVKRTDGTDLGTTTFYEAEYFTDLITMVDRVGNTLYFSSANFAFASGVTPESIRTLITLQLPLGFEFAGNEQTALIGTRNSLWSSDGTPQGTFIINAEYRSSSSWPLEVERIGDQYYYYQSTYFGRESIWVTDGTINGTHEVAPSPANGRIVTGRLSAEGRLISSIDGKLLFTAGDGVSGVELWISDGSDAGTHLLRDLVPGNSGSDPAELFAWNDQLFIGGTTLGGIQRLGGDNSP